MLDLVGTGRCRNCCTALRISVHAGILNTKACKGHILIPKDKPLYVAGLEPKYGLENDETAVEPLGATFVASRTRTSAFVAKRPSSARSSRWMV